MRTEKTTAYAMSSIVAGRRCRTSVITGCDVRRDMPKSPRTTRWM